MRWTQKFISSVAFELRRNKMMYAEFDWENTWKEYKEIALLPTLILYMDKDVYSYYSLIFHFINVKVAITFRK